MSAVDAPPAIPTEFQVYDSYTVDPTYQLKFTIIWVSVAGAAILASLPRLIRSFRRGCTWAGVTGITDNPSGKEYESVPIDLESISKLPKTIMRKGRFGRVQGILWTLKSFLMWPVPNVGLDLGQAVLVIAYFVVVILCITVHAELVDNPNRAGFIAIAQLPVVFLLATKNSLLSLALGPGFGWEKLNFLHRWAGRGLFLGAAIHVSLWIRNRLEYGLPIIGQWKETSGLACFGLLCVIVLSSLKPVRVWAYQFFLLVHISAFVAFLITLCYHTIYVRPYIFPPFAFYGFDLLLRVFRCRVRDATLYAPDRQMTLIRVQNSNYGWTAGQHVRLRVFFSSRVFESHPLTICNAPLNTTCLSERSLLLGTRAVGDWSKALNTYACNALSELSKTEENAVARPVNPESIALKERDTESDEDIPVIEPVDLPAGVPVQVMVDGPYGGCSSIDIGEYERVFLVAGGSGITFILGLLDDLVGRCARLERRGGEQTRHVEVAWYVRSFGCFRWFAAQLMEIALLAERDPSLTVHISVFVTCGCAPESVQAIPNCDIRVGRPEVRQLLEGLANADSSTEDGEGKKKVSPHEGGGLAVCAAGPESLARHAKNALVRISLTSGGRLGRTGCHTEVYSL